MIWEAKRLNSEFTHTSLDAMNSDFTSHSLVEPQVSDNGPRHDPFCIPMSGSTWTFLQWYGLRPKSLKSIYWFEPWFEECFHVWSVNRSPHLFKSGRTDVRAGSKWLQSIFRIFVFFFCSALCLLIFVFRRIHLGWDQTDVGQWFPGLLGRLVESNGLHNELLVSGNHLAKDCCLFKGNKLHILKSSVFQSIYKK